MIRLNVTAEGFSEEKFAKEMLAPHLVHFGIVVDVRKVLTSRKLRKRGGIVSYPKFKNDVEQWIKEQPQAYHTTFIDLYGLVNDFPNFKASIGRQAYDRVASIEQGIAEDINYYKFIPYIQLHEYEGLLFSDTVKLEMWLSLYNRIPVGNFQRIKDEAGGNAELINEGPETAPSKRILSICDAYDKVNDGVHILQEIGMQKLREECAHFNEWISRLEQLK